jgi:cyclophilin family peptidyl-prolyl cis-trans isomerase
MNTTTLARLFLVALLAGMPARLAAESKDPAPPNPVYIITTSMGAVTVELDRTKAPLTVENFIRYAETGLYTGTVFHRVIPGFMIQGGGFTRDMQQKPTQPAIKNESQNGLSNRRGTIAMARTSVVDSATSQFFINLADNVLLDHGVRDYGYAVFGKVIAGMETVDEIARVKTGSRSGHQNVPIEPVVITGITKK